MDETDLMLIAEPEETTVPVVLADSLAVVDEEAEWVWRRRRDETLGDMP